VDFFLNTVYSGCATGEAANTLLTALITIFVFIRHLINLKTDKKAKKIMSAHWWQWSIFLSPDALTLAAQNVLTCVWRPDQLDGELTALSRLIRRILGMG